MTAEGVGGGGGGADGFQQGLSIRANAFATALGEGGGGACDVARRRYRRAAGAWRFERSGAATADGVEAVAKPMGRAW